MYQFSYIALFAWPLVMLVLFRKLDLQSALVWSLTGGYLLLPTSLEISIDLPLLPALDKNFVPALAAALLCTLAVRRAEQARRLGGSGRTLPQPPAIGPVQRGWIPRSTVGMALLALMLGGTVMTTLTNGDVQVYGPTVMPGLRPFDTLSNLLGAGVTLLPLLLGRKFLADDHGQEVLLKVMCFAALGYSVLAFYEIRMSPQLNLSIYGFFPHSWIQHIRAGGYRPLVFLDHGLRLGIFFAGAIIAATILMRRQGGSKRMIYVLALLWLLLALLVSKTLGAFSIALLMIPIAFLMPVRLQLLVAAVIAGSVLLYPMLRGSGLIPIHAAAEFFARIDPERAGSLLYRLGNEDILLAKANERPLFGWGGWGRNRVFDENGLDISVTDGSWVIAMGVWGWIGYIAVFGLYTLPIIVLAFRQRRMRVSLVTGGVALIIAANLINLIPNSGLSPMLWLAMGGLLGRLEQPRQVADTAAETPDPAAADAPAERRTRHSRFAPRHMRQR